ncbi:glycoside hydrolase family 113 [Cryptosporangium sp. NPDC051539]|uniref:glycoside hydrolase family 113 n=1 Tax=Cryptosporangium sp. NPDC051539 TaxID=3363962 RepID=UPI00378DFF45
MPRPSIGFDLVSWSAEVNSDTAAWVDEIDRLRSVGVDRVTLVPYRFVSAETGRLSAQSAYGLNTGPSDAVLAAAIRRALAHGLDVGLMPLLELDQPEGIGRQWRGTLTLSGEPADEFFLGYGEYLAGLVRLAPPGGPLRMSIGSELRGLTSDRALAPRWRALIAGLRPTSPLNYCANWDEFDRVPFWDDLDGISVNAYFPLASPRAAEGVGNPSAATLRKGWGPHLRTLRALAESRRRPLTISEWGTVPYDLTSTAPWNWRPTETPDPAEQFNAYDATLRAITDQGAWLAACDFWHWRMPGSEGSAYAVGPPDAVVDLIRAYVRGEG